MDHALGGHVIECVNYLCCVVASASGGEGTHARYSRLKLSVARQVDDENCVRGLAMKERPFVCIEGRRPTQTPFVLESIMQAHDARMTALATAAVRRRRTRSQSYEGVFLCDGRLEFVMALEMLFVEDLAGVLAARLLVCYMDYLIGIEG